MLVFDLHNNHNSETVRCVHIIFMRFMKSEAVLTQVKKPNNNLAR